MRAIKFRGYCDFEEEWAYGYLVKSKYYRSQPILYSFIHTPHPKEHNKPSDITMVDHETIGQFTGLIDKNGVEIYEGDIIKDTHYYKSLPIKWYDNGFWLQRDDGGKTLPNMEFREIIGNIHDKENK